jgi:hypothetical protein
MTVTRVFVSRGQRHGRGFRPCKRQVQKQVAEVAKALYQRTDERAVLLARAIAVRGRRR